MIVWITKGTTDGRFWIQRLSRLKRERLVKKFEKMTRGWVSVPANIRLV
ncbi:hypothetical protein GWG65_19780 [Bradyrhizobium sp. CSA207]|nr:hypothetical protein [Bradyrhizobium sp. CSA207]MDE5443644.1 hypothetical protein [Bradyrhizobium sp. CSA207]